MLERIYLVITKEDMDTFHHRQGFSEFQQDCRRNNLELIEYFEETFEANHSVQNSMLLTDNRDVADAWRSQNGYASGLQSDTAEVYFPGVDMVITSFLGIDAAFFKDNYLRFLGLPVTICQTERLLIRESVPEDFSQLFHMSQNCGQYVFEEDGTESFAEAEEKFLAYIHWVYSFLGFGLWTVTKKNGEVIGRCGLSLVSDDKTEESHMELGYVIRTDQQRRGYGSEACAAILKYAGEELKLDRVYVCIHKKNQASRQFAEKLGFQITSYPVPDNQYQMFLRSLI